MTAPRAVYFAKGSAELDNSGRATLQEFLRGLTSDPSERSIVRLRAHADRSGGRAFNRKLSARRAEQVSDYLTALGVASGKIVVEVAGEDEPLVDTPDGVSELQNRVVWLQETKSGSSEQGPASLGPPTVC